MVDVLQQKKFRRTAFEKGVYLLKSKERRCWLGLYVDDNIIAGSTTTIVNIGRLLLSSRFKMQELVKILCKSPGIDIIHNSTKIIVSMDSHLFCW